MNIIGIQILRKRENVVPNSFKISTSMGSLASQRRPKLIIDTEH